MMSGPRNGPLGSELFRCAVFEGSRDGNMVTVGSDVFLLPEDNGGCDWIFEVELARGTLDDEGDSALAAEEDGLVGDCRDQGCRVPVVQ